MDDARGSVGRTTSRSTSEDLARTVRQTQGTVTAFVEHLVDERVVADVVAQVGFVAPEDNALGVEPGHPLIRRVALLRGRLSERGFVLAETEYVPDRLPRVVQRGLLETDDPIGHVLLRHQLAFSRVDLPSIDRVSGPPDGTLWDRRYRLDLAGTPTMDITEWFLDALLPFLPRTGES